MSAAPVICFGQQPCGFFPKRFLVAKIQTARRLQAELGGEIVFFYHDSDHTYDHMMFEFTQAKRKLTPGGLVVGDDISWNASVWDFADQYGVPSYNFKGAVGVAFF